MFCQLLLLPLLLHNQQFLLHLVQCLHLILHLILHPVHHPVHLTIHHTILLHLLLTRELILLSLLSRGQGPMHPSIQTTPGGPSDTTLHNGGRSLMKETGCPGEFQDLQFHHSTSTFHNHHHLLILHLSQRLYTSLTMIFTWTVTHLMSWM